ncbi:MAG: NYN domain-containing protein [Coriobacteriia bacterium]|nr:NYN domain-containing protein [Coriobacteriia bacterium]
MNKEMMQYFIDGYNATMRDEEMAQYSKENQREMLIARVGSAGSRVLGVGRYTVVFDARDQWQSVSEQRGAVKIVYAPDADTDIVARCSKAGKSITVVTDDMRLRARISQDIGRHVKFLPTNVLFDEPISHKTVKKNTMHTDVIEGQEPIKNARGITRELEKLWLDEDGE